MTVVEIPLPRRPEPARPYSFPLVATIAPVIGAFVVWSITRSPFALIFAVLGPIVAIGSLLDARLQRKRTAKREGARFLRDVDVTSQRIEAAKQSLRDTLRARWQGGSGFALAPAGDPERWRYRDGPLPISLGLGEQLSGLRLTGGAAAQNSFAVDELVDGAYERLRAEALWVEGAPVTVDAVLGIAICGRGPAVTAVARSLVIQLAAALSPADWALRVSDTVEPWVSGLPHPRAGRAEGQRIEFARMGTLAGRPEEKRFIIAVGNSPAELPWDCRLWVSVVGAQAEILRQPGRSEGSGAPAQSDSVDEGAMAGGVLRADLVSRRLAENFAAGLTETARAEGLGGAAEPPEKAALAHTWAAATPAHGTLPAAFLAGADGAVTVDLVSDGPHAVVGGTTGSGKSELLISWVLALARNHSPQEFSCLLVDFKGGSSFTALASIPHCVGLMTDLDPGAARRALESLRAELRHRERRLAEAGARTIEELSPGEPLPRLLIIVDEFAAMIGDFADLHTLFADIAARGRSLGMHLILCTQRPGGVLRDSVMANCTLRISLRVNNGADSTAVVGTPDAAALPARPLGRALITTSGEAPRLVQVAIAEMQDAVAVAEAWRESPPPRRPWLPPLPDSVAFEQLPRPQRGLAFGMLDMPEEQRQPAAVWQPATHGNLVIVGGAGSGKSSALAAFFAAAGGDALAMPADVEGAWDMLEQLAEDSHPATLVLIDDVDALIARFDEKWRHVVVERIGSLLRDGGTGGLRVAISARRISPALQPIAALCDSQLLLRLASRQEHVLAGGDSAQYDPELRPGGAHWQGHSARIAWVPPHSRLVRESTPRRRLLDGPASELAARHLIVTSRPAAYGAARHNVADPAGWQARWAEFASLRRTHPVIFDRCTVAEFRSISGIATLPPILGREPGGAWLLACDGTVERVQLPNAL